MLDKPINTGTQLNFEKIIKLYFVPQFGNKKNSTQLIWNQPGKDYILDFNQVKQLPPPTTVY